jgi:hypothetical protein
MKRITKKNSKVDTSRIKEKSFTISQLDKVNRPIQVILTFVQYMELKQFVAKFDTTISEVVRTLITEHLDAVERNEIKNNHCVKR